MSCTNSLCLDQLLEPDAPDELVILNNNGSPSAFETGVLNLAQGVSSADIAFAVRKLSSEYLFQELVVENIVDPSPLTIIATPTDHSIAGFSVSLSGVTDTPNYRLRWAVEVVEV